MVEEEMTEQYIVRELKQDIKYLIKRVGELESKLERAHPTQKPVQDVKFNTESQKMQDELEPIKND
jgi:hypothetical protein